MKSRIRRPIPYIVGVLGIVAAAVGIAVDRGSPERGNRLYRHGDATQAAALYAVLQPDHDAVSGYNLGTALLAIDERAAAEELASVVTRARDPGLQQQATYNLGIAQLSLAMHAEADEEARSAAVAAVQSNRAVLRGSPGRADAAWNLGVALRLIASLDAGEGAPGKRVAMRSSGRVKPADRDNPAPVQLRAGDFQTRAAADGEGLSPEDIERLSAAAMEDPVRTTARIIAQAGHRRPAQIRPSPNTVDTGADR